MNRVIHFDVQADDIERAKIFYEKTFGWEIKQIMKQEEGGMDYWGIDTGKGPGISGGMSKRSSKKEDQFYFYNCTIEVADIDEAIKQVKANGGAIIREKSEIPHVGWFASAKDTEGNRFELLQPTEWKPD